MKFGKIGYWSEIKLDIVRDDVKEYSKILANQVDASLHHVYIDGIAGGGLRVSRRTGKPVRGVRLSPWKSIRLSVSISLSISMGTRSDICVESSVNGQMFTCSQATAIMCW